ncbi:MAG: ATP-binding cassette domain-containing protein [Roseburia sp.]
MLLEFEHVTGNDRKFHLEDVSFSLPAGYLMGLAGKNGAGKTTLLRYILSPRSCYTGAIRINGVDIRNNHRESRGKIALISEDNPFFREKSARVNAELLGMLYPDWDMPLFQEIMRKLEVSEGRAVGQMSRGEQMKFQMAFAMAHHPVLYLLDEATAGMDPVFRLDYFKLLQEVIAGEEASVVMTSHIQEEIRRKMDYVGILEAGRLVSFGQTIDETGVEKI